MRSAAALISAALAFGLGACGGGQDGGGNVPAVPFGFADGAYGGADARTAATKAKDAGAEVVRVLVRWDSAERTRGAVDFGAAGDEIKALTDVGITPLPVITSSPPWARDAADGCPDQLCPPAEARVTDFARFAAKVVETFKGVEAVEIWNEPNSTIDWKTRTGPDAKRYARLLQAASDAIHAAGAKVVLAGLAPVVDDARRGRISPARFLKAVYATVRPDSFDAIGVHPYPHGGGLPAVDRMLDTVRAVRDRAGDGARELWATEAGYPTGMAARNGLPDVPGEVSPEAQGTRLLQLYDHLAAMPDLRLILFWRLRDDAAAPAERGYGVLNGDWSPKPGYCALAERFGKGC